MNELETALKQFVSEQPRRVFYERYYSGNHELNFASQKFKNAFGATLKELYDNLCENVVDAPVDRLEIINFSAREKESDRAWEIWQRNLMELESGEVHREAIKTGDGFLIVWEDEQMPGSAKFSPQSAANCTLVYDASTGREKYGAKLWRDDFKRIRLNLYYADRVEKWATDKKEIELSAAGANNFRRFEEEEGGSAVPNPWGIVPMFHFKHNAGTAQTGTSILHNAIPLQKGLNKALCDLFVAMEFSSFRQRFVTGVELEYETVGNEQIPKPIFSAGVDRIWHSSDPNAKFGDLGASDLEQFLKVQDSMRLAMARTTKTPLHYFQLNTSHAMSGEALKALESQFVKRVMRCQIGFGAVWAKAMSLALKIEGAGESEVENLMTQWTPAEQRSESEMLANALLKKDLGVDDETLLEEIGYSTDQIQAMMRKKAQLLKEQQAAFDAGTMENNAASQSA